MESIFSSPIRATPMSSRNASAMLSTIQRGQGRSEQRAQKPSPNPARMSDSLSRGRTSLNGTLSVPPARPVRHRHLTRQPAVWRSRWPCHPFWPSRRRCDRLLSTGSSTMAAAPAFLVALSTSVPFLDIAWRRVGERATSRFRRSAAVHGRPPSRRIRRGWRTDPVWVGERAPVQIWRQFLRSNVRLQIPSAPDKSQSVRASGGSHRVSVIPTP